MHHTREKQDRHRPRKRQEFIPSLSINPNIFTQEVNELGYADGYTVRECGSKSHDAECRHQGYDVDHTHFDASAEDAYEGEEEGDGCKDYADPVEDLQE